MIEEKWENIEATNLSPLKEKKIPLKPSQPLLRVERSVADYHLHGLSSSLARLYQLVSYIRRGQSATSSVRARGRPPSPSLSPSSPWNISISRHPTCTIGFIRVANTPKSAPAEKNAKAWLNPEERILLLLLLLAFSFGHALLLARSLARSDPLGPRGARVNDRSLGQPQAVASESHTRCIRHVPRAGEQRDPPDWFSP